MQKLVMLTTAALALAACGETVNQSSRNGDQTVYVVLGLEHKPGEASFQEAERRAMARAAEVCNGRRVIVGHKVVNAYNSMHMTYRCGDP